MDPRTKCCMRLYQWMSYDTFKKAIGNGCFYVRATRPWEFNDPFDCTGGVFGTPSSDFVSEFFILRQDKQMCFESKFKMGFLGNNRDEAAKKEVEGILRHMLQDRKFLGQGYRIACFSDADRINLSDETLMWAHYGEKGRGVRVCIELDGSDFDLVHVDYKDEPPQIDLGVIGTIDELGPFFKKCIWTKHRSWQYENEVRAIFSGPSHPNIYPYRDPVTKYKCERLRIEFAQMSEIAIGQLRLNQDEFPDDVISTLREIQKVIGFAGTFKSAVLNYNTYGYDYLDLTI